MVVRPLKNEGGGQVGQEGRSAGILALLTGVQVLPGPCAGPGALLFRPCSFHSPFCLSAISSLWPEDAVRLPSQGWAS